MSYNVAIILSDTLQALGIKHILSESFSISPKVFMSFDNVLDMNNDVFDFYFTSSDLFLQHLDFFLPRKHKIIIVTNDTNNSSDINQLCCSCDESSIINNLNQYFAKATTNNAEHQNEQLSQRETDVLRLIATGMINKEIADNLNISINTVLTHRKNITSKLGIKSVSGLTFYAMMNGIIAPK